MATTRNEFLDAGFNDDSDHDEGYDSEAAEMSKGRQRGNGEGRAKRRKLSSDHDDEDGGGASEAEDEQDSPAETTLKEHTLTESGKPITSQKKQEKKDKKKPIPGVIYLSSLPPYLKPSALRNLLTQRGFAPITRLFLTPSSKSKSHHAKKNSRQLYSEGWIEFASKKTARRCAETLNASPVGGKKGGFYHDDVWNMRYLRGMLWGELMAGIAGEKREEEGRRDEERRRIGEETKAFVRGVEEGRAVVGMQKKRRRRAGGADDGGEAVGEGDVKRTWRQFEVKGGKDAVRRNDGGDEINDDVKRVLGKIF